MPRLRRVLLDNDRQARFNRARDIPMITVSLVPFLIVGLLGAPHCVGMCGGIVGALSMGGRGNGWNLQLAYNLGRITSYSVIGALAGAAGAGGLLLDGVLPVQHALYLAANLMLLALGFHLERFHVDCK